MPLASQVVDAIARQLPDGCPRSTLVFADPTAALAYTPRRVLTALREAGPNQTSEAIRSRLPGRRPTLGTVHDALWQLETAGLVAREDANAGQPRWSATDRPRDNSLDNLKLRGPHDLRHTFSTWLEDAGIPARVIDELMGHAGGHRGGDGSAIGLRYGTPLQRWRPAWWPRSSSGWQSRWRLPSRSTRSQHHD